MSNGDYNRTRILLENSSDVSCKSSDLFPLSQYLQRIILFVLDGSSIQIPCCSLSCKFKLSCSNSHSLLNFPRIFAFSSNLKDYQTAANVLEILEELLDALIHNSNQERRLKHHSHRKQRIWNFPTLYEFEFLSLEIPFDTIYFPLASSIDLFITWKSC